MGRIQASIDVGTNTLRLLIADVGSDGRVHPIVKERVITRLGEGFDGEIKERAAERTLEALKTFAQRLSAFPVERMRAVGTSVLRRASNREWFIERAVRETGIRIDVISGREEAFLSAIGALSVVGDGRRALIFDVGGGSTEYIFYERGIRTCHSIDLGVVSLTEAFLHTDPPAPRELEGMEEVVEEGIMGLIDLIRQEGFDPSFYSRGGLLVGTAGTPTTLAAIDQALRTYDPERINGYRLSFRTIQEIYRRLTSLSVRERMGVVGLERGREDVIIPGTVVVLKTMSLFGFQEMVVSDAGLLEGVIYRFLEPCKEVVQ